MNRMFLDVNVIQSFPSNCMNRDDTGSPKSCVYGGVRRARVSSQCWKHAVRKMFSDRFDESELGVRTRYVANLVADHISRLDPSVSDERAQEAAMELLSKTRIKMSSEEGDPPETKAVMFISNRQAADLARLAIGGNYSRKDVEAALSRGHGVEIALFGRMVAEEPSLGVDACCQVAHSISTHRVCGESDFYTATEDMSGIGSGGAGMVGNIEFSSSTMYRYATVSFHDLVSTLGSVDAALKAATEFVRAFVLSLPSGHGSSFAGWTVPYAVYVAARTDRPVNLVGAFEEPVPSGMAGYNAASSERMAAYEIAAESSFVSVPKASWTVGMGMDGLGKSSDLESVLDSIGVFLAGEAGI